MHRHAQLALAQDDVTFLGGKPFGKPDRSEYTGQRVQHFRKLPGRPGEPVSDGMTGRPGVGIPPIACGPRHIQPYQMLHVVHFMGRGRVSEDQVNAHPPCPRLPNDVERTVDRHQRHISFPDDLPRHGDDRPRKREKRNSGHHHPGQPMRKGPFPE